MSTMSLTQTHISPIIPLGAGPSSWAPEINDLQKYRDSLKVMAERVSQAEHMWAKSLEPPQSPQTPKTKPRRGRKLSRSHRPTALERPFLPKRIRTDEPMYSPDPFQLLSPAMDSDDEVYTPLSAWSTNMSPIKSPVAKSGRSHKRAAEANVPSITTSSIDARQPLKHAEDLLDQAVHLVSRTIAEVKSSPHKEGKIGNSIAIKASKASRQARNTAVQVHALADEARRRSTTVPTASDLLKGSLDDGAQLENLPNAVQSLSEVKTRLQTWASGIRKAQESIAINSTSNPVQGPATPLSAS